MIRVDWYRECCCTDIKYNMISHYFYLPTEHNSLKKYIMVNDPICLYKQKWIRLVKKFPEYVTIETNKKKTEKGRFCFCAHALNLITI